MHLKHQSAATYKNTYLFIDFSNEFNRSKHTFLHVRLSIREIDMDIVVEWETTQRNARHHAVSLGPAGRLHESRPKISSAKLSCRVNLAPVVWVGGGAGGGDLPWDPQDPFPSPRTRGCCFNQPAPSSKRPVTSRLYSLVSLVVSCRKVRFLWKTGYTLKNLNGGNFFREFIPSGSCHKRQKPQAPTPQATIRNRQTRKVANAKVLNRNTNLT